MNAKGMWTRKLRNWSVTLIVQIGSQKLPSSIYEQRKI